MIFLKMFYVCDNSYPNIPKHFQNVPHPPYQVSQIAQCSKQECEMEGLPLSAKDAVENTNWDKHTIYKHKRRQEDAQELENYKVHQEGRGKLHHSG